MHSLPELPNLHALAVMSLTVITLYLFTRDKLRLELTSLGLLVVLAVGFSIFPLANLNPLSLFYGFAHEAFDCSVRPHDSGSRLSKDRRARSSRQFPRKNLEKKSGNRLPNDLDFRSHTVRICKQHTSSCFTVADIDRSLLQ